MARKSVPKLRKQKKKSGHDLAFVELGGVRHYVGAYGSKDAEEAYIRLLSEWSANGGHSAVEPDSLTVVELIAAYWKHAETYYANPDGDSTSELSCFRQAFKPLMALYGETPSKDFGPIALKAVRQRMVESGWCRPYVNRQVFRIKRVFKWASSEELLPASIFQRLESVESLRYGRTDAPEPERIQPIDDVVVEETVKHLTPTVRAMVTVQRWTGMRPGEVCRMRLADMDMTCDPWVYSPQHHKTKYRGKVRKIYLGPKAQEAMRPYLQSGFKGYLFSPERSEIERQSMRHANRITLLSCGNNPGSNRQIRPNRKPGERYTPMAYGKSITYACRRAFLAPAGMTGDDIKQWRKDYHWSPNQLRHSFATMVRRERGLEDAQVLLGHAQSDVTQVYAERDEQRVIETIRKIG